MQFDKLRLAGFKSFVDTSDVMIEPGLTGVVGPNGCGKSNLVEAMRWVMGEVSHKAVRGGAMDDVIFAGSGRRPARDVAEVTLVLDNEARTAPADLNNADTLEVTRRITRGMGSDYRVNGKLVRARDVQILFADAATGSRSPSMVRQGQVAELIAAKPTDRRGILEDAAGIGGLRARKHEASLKLNAAEQALAKLENASIELERQLQALRRQANQAKRYRAVAADIRQLEASLYHLAWRNAREALADAETALSEARAALKTAAAAQTEAATALAAEQHRIQPARDAAEAAAEAARKADSDVAAFEARETARVRELAAAQADAARLEADMERLAAAETDATSALSKLAAEAEAIARQNEGAEARRAQCDTAVRAAEGASERAEATLRQAVETAAEVKAAHAAAAQRAQAATAEAERAGREHARLTDALRKATESNAIAERDAARTALATAQAEEEAASAATETADTAVTGAREAARAAQSALDALDREVKAVASEMAALERLTATLGSTDAVLADCTVNDGLERAFAVAVGDDLEAPVSANAPRRWTTTACAADAPLPADAACLADYVNAPAALGVRLSQIGLVCDSEGSSLQRQLKPGQRLVSRAGALWRWDGFAVSAGAPSPAAERLAQKNQLAALKTKHKGLEPKLAAARETHSATAEAARVAGQDAMIAVAALQAARKASAQALQRVTRADTAARDAIDAQAKFSAEAGAAEARLADAKAVVDETAKALGQQSNGAAEVAARDQAQAAAVEARAALTSARNAAEQERRAQEGRTKALSRIERERGDWQRRAAGADDHRADLAARRKASLARATELTADPNEIDYDRRRLKTAAQKARAAADEAATAVRDAEHQVRDAEATALRTRDTLAEARESVGRHEERLAAGTERVAEARAAHVAALELAPETVSPATLLPDTDVPALSARLDKLKAERTRIGAVNLCAETELEELEERSGTMAAERDDVLAAIETLRNAIKTLNKDARGRLLGAFDQVNSEFQRLFTHLFGGGEAELRLTEADDPLDAGLEIIARPPGKKPQHLSLLSGGEQTLTATALIFAVFLTNPSPICVLDEIDAPLDDANVERFCALLDEMDRRTDTRFLIITHNPITMARMHRLYGVTMVERGVSQLVSVNLSAAEALRESA